jgi:hypothetical protein
MRDYQEAPSPKVLEIYLIQNPEAFDTHILNEIHTLTKNNKEIITVERLFKGEKSALLISGTKHILEKFKPALNLLELEDFTKVSEDQVSAWEIGVKNQIPRPLSITNIFGSLPKINEDEQFWWQLTLQSQSKKNGFITMLEKSLLGKKPISDDSFQCQIRAVVISADATRRQQLTEELESLGQGVITKIPRPLNSGQILSNYRKRAIIPADKYLITLNSEEVMQLVGKIN